MAEFFFVADGENNKQRIQKYRLTEVLLAWKQNSGGQLVALSGPGLVSSEKE